MARVFTKSSSSSSSSSTSLSLSGADLNIDHAAFQHVRAAHVKAGGIAVHTHRVIHWGNHGESDSSCYYSTDELVAMTSSGSAVKDGSELDA